jgi:hypothetical protein
MPVLCIVWFVGMPVDQQCGRSHCLAWKQETSKCFDSSCPEHDLVAGPWKLPSRASGHVLSYCKPQLPSTKTLSRQVGVGETKDVSPSLSGRYCVMLAEPHNNTACTLDVHFAAVADANTVHPSLPMR